MRLAFSRKRWLRVHGVDPEAWARRWGIEPFTAPCGLCGRELATTVPVATKELRGMEAPPCACGNDMTPYCVVRDWRKGDLLEEWGLH